MRKKFLSIALAVGLVASMAAGVLSVSASNHVDETVIHYDAIYFPWVPNVDDIDGTGPWTGSITVQNVTDEDYGVRFFVFDDKWTWSVANDPLVTFADALTGLPDDSQLFNAGEKVPTFVLAPRASQSITPATLGLDEPGSGVSIYGVYRYAWEDSMREEPLCEDGNDEIADSFTEGEGEDAVTTCVYAPPVVSGVQKQAADEPMSSMVRTSDDHESVDGYTAIPLVDVSWGSQSDFCHEIAGGVDFCDGAGYYVSPGGFGPGFDFDGHSYIPIAQTNAGWNTELYITNVDFTTTTAASVDVTLITTDQQGYGASGAVKWSDTLGIAPGHTEVIDVSSIVGPEWVGSVHITSEVGVVAAAYRSKAETDMMLTNTSAPSLWANPEFDEDFNETSLQAVGPNKYEQYAPLIFQNYNGWNSGLSFVNNAEFTNTVTVTFYGPTGNVVGSDQRTISPLGQEFIYIPYQQDLELGGPTGSGFVGSAVFSSDLPFHIAVDQVKYSTGEAMSYLATASGAQHPGGRGGSDWPGEGRDRLFLPLVQKGSQDGSGDISGLQFFNAHANYATYFDVTFYDGSGAAIAPTKDTPYPMTLGPLHTGTIYTLNLSEMSQGQRSSIIVDPDNFGGGEGTGVIVGVSNNVNYDVQGDGAAAYNMVNGRGQYRFPVPGFIPEIEEEFEGN